MSAIWAEGLTKHFDEVRAVDGIDLDIAAGTIFGFLGQNGSGKTTTIRMLTTLLRPTAGRARVDGFDILDDARAVRNRIGVALQEAGLDDIQTGRELLTLQARLFGLRGGARRRRIEELLAIVDLEDAADRAVGTYSGGMKRRLDLAAALVHRPGVIFLDEPTTGLDPVSREGIWRYVNRLSVEDGITIFLTTQYLEEADRLAHDLAIIDEGRIIARGSPAEMKASIGTDVVTVEVEAPEALDHAAEVATAVPAVERVQIADGAAVVYVPDGARAVARIVIALDDAGIEVGNVSISRPSLDDVFLEATGHHLRVEEPAPVDGGAA
ncbi:MAG: ATP-binding cassette domain-containing protein [Chloroflexi bacterium]|nr:ATP-binding cassette domain-containing protein [Chloroflexota bacterium]